MRRAALRAGTVAGLLFCLLGPAASVRAGEKTRPEDVYLRSVRTIERAFHLLEGEAEQRGVEQVLFVLDAASFAPPPGVTELSYEYGYFHDLDKWIDGLGTWAAPNKRSFRATSSWNPKTVEVGKGNWKLRLRDIVTRPWWAHRKTPKFEPALRWIRRLLDRTAIHDLGGGGPAPRMLVLVGGALTPERWVVPGTRYRKDYEFEWRRKLLPVGEYWEEEKVGALLAGANCPLFVVAPEARFGDMAPIPEMPQLPWAARPQHPHPMIALGLSRLFGGLAPGMHEFPGELVSRTLAGYREHLERDPELKKQFPDREERRKEIDRRIAEMARRLSERRVPDSIPMTPRNDQGVPTLAHLPQAGKRFFATTPMWFWTCGDAVLFNNDAPSGYGQWPYARTAARSGGRYLFYPFPPSEWLDKCPYDGAQLNRLMPELIPFRKFTREREGDRAADAIARAVRLVVDDTPWADTGWQRAASGWGGFARTRPLKREPKWFLRRKPYDLATSQTERDLPRMGQRIESEVLPKYDEAMRRLDETLRTVDRNAVHPRSLANLRLARFWFAMSAFHLHGLAIYAQELDRFIPPAMRWSTDGVYITYVPAIRLSDCLEAYDGRRLSIADEMKYEPWDPGCPGYQGRILQIPEDDPNYRAQRNLGSVLARLDKRLKGRALQMVQNSTLR